LDLIAKGFGKHGDERETGFQQVPEKGVFLPNIANLDFRLTRQWILRIMFFVDKKYEDMPKWRNWQTRTTQNRVPKRSVGSSPTFGTSKTRENDPWFLIFIKIFLLTTRFLHVKLYLVSENDCFCILPGRGSAW
jgi:hypothetical protein